MDLIGETLGVANTRGGNGRRLNRVVNDEVHVPRFGAKGEPMVCIPSAPYPESLDDYITINAAEGFPDQ